MATVVVVLETIAYHSSNKLINLVLIVPNIYVIISLIVTDTVASIQLHILVSLGPGPSDPVPDLLALVIITILGV